MSGHFVHTTLINHNLVTNSRGGSSRRFEDRFVSSLLQAKCLFQIRACDSQDVYALQSLAARGVSGADVLLRH